MSFTTDELSTDSAMDRRAAVVHAKEQCTRAAAAVEQAKLQLEARMLDVQVAKEEQDSELVMLTLQALEKAQQEYTKKQGFHNVLMDQCSKLAESEVHATTNREITKYGSLGRVPSSSLIVNEEIQEDDPWLDADIGRYFRGPPPFSRTRVAKFYKKHHWNRVIASRSKVQCMVTGLWSSSNSEIRVGRILPKTTSNNVLKDLGLSQRDINNPRNMLLLSSNLKKYFDVQRLTFVLHEEGMPHEIGLRFRLKVWDTALFEKNIFKGSKMTIGDCDGKVFRFYSDEHIPFLRALSFHAQCSYERAQKKRYLQPGEERPAEFGSPLLCESITCDSSLDDIDDGDDDDYSLESDRSIATEQMLESLDYEAQ